MSSATPAEIRWDVIVVGGALSGAATATPLLRRNAAMRVLILEKSEQFDRRVGESTVEISAFFLGRVLGLTDYLNQHHLVKQGMRFWFANDQVRNLAECSETGPAYNVRFPGYQVDRAAMDEEVLARAVAAGAQLLRGVRVSTITLMAGGQQTVEWKAADGTQQRASARWVVDASGFAAVLARKNGWFQTNHDHPIAACWSRWKGVKSWDAREFVEKYPDWSRRSKAVRFTATNHVTGRGWWSWWIPLKGGDVSVGIVYDQRLIELPPGEKLGDRLKDFLLKHPAGRDLLSDATYQEGDVHFRRNCAYVSKTFAGDGFVLVGDAAAFMDPFYSPGMDWICFSSNAAAALINACLRGRPAQPRVARHNELFATSYQRWFDAIYRDKYYYMGDHELMTLAFRLDLGLYYFGVVSQPFKYGERALETPAFAGPYTRWPAALLALYNRRLAAMARSRMKRGTWGRNNARHYFPFISYQLDRRLIPHILWALTCWLGLEMREGWRTWFAARPVAAPQPTDGSVPVAGVGDPGPASARPATALRATDVASASTSIQA